MDEVNESERERERENAKKTSERERERGGGGYLFRTISERVSGRQSDELLFFIFLTCPLLYILIYKNVIRILI